MQKLIPTIYFYLLSAVGMILIIIGLFNTIHYIIGITVYDKYPLGYGAESRCMYTPKPVVIDGGAQEATESASENIANKECLENLEIERQNKKVDDLEKSITFTLIGLLVFGGHFYFARRQRMS